MAAVRSFEELAVQNGHHSIIKDAKKYAEELDLQLWLNFPDPVAVADGKEVEAKNLQSPSAGDTINGIWGEMARKAYKEHVRWDNEKVKMEECFAWLSSWTNAPTHTIAGVKELYQGLLQQKNKITIHWWKSRLCGDSLENVQHILSDCSALAQTKYLQRHNDAFKILFFEITKVEP